mgnify:CR=1 FL=1
MPSAWLRIGMERGANQQHPDDGEHDPTRHDAEAAQTHRPPTLGGAHAPEVEIFLEAAPPSSRDLADAGARDPAQADDAEEPRTERLREQPRGPVVGLGDVRQRAREVPERGDEETRVGERARGETEALREATGRVALAERIEDRRGSRPTARSPRARRRRRPSRGAAEGLMPDHLDGAGLRHRCAVRAERQLQREHTGHKVDDAAHDETEAREAARSTGSRRAMLVDPPRAMGSAGRGGQGRSGTAGSTSVRSPLGRRWSGVAAATGVSGRHRLMGEEARLSPSVEMDGEREPQAAQQIGAHHVAEPVLALVDARKPHEEDEHGRRATSSVCAAPRWLEQGVDEECEEPAEGRELEHVSARKARRGQLAEHVDQVRARPRSIDHELDERTDADTACRKQRDRPPPIGGLPMNSNTTMRTASHVDLWHEAEPAETNTSAGRRRRRGSSVRRA